jgi:hypothetical protein
MKYQSGMKEAHTVVSSERDKGLGGTLEKLAGHLFLGESWELEKTHHKKGLVEWLKV